MTSRTYPRLVTPPPGPKARAVIERDTAWTSPSYIKEYPLVIAGGQGAMVEDVDGNRFIDYMAGIAVSSTGYNHPKVVAAIQEQAGKFLHICGTDFYFEGFARLAERLAQLAPGKSRKRTFLSNSGTEAIEGAIKLARYHTRRPALIAFQGSFHGRTYGAMSLTSSKAKQHKHFGPLLPEVYHIPYANPYRSADPIDHALSALHDLFTRQVDPTDVAAIFVEPVQGEGGYVIPPVGFLAELRKICDQHGILLVADEVQSGVGRTGKMWACEWDNVEPDIIVSAKGLGSGMPIGAFIAKESVMTWEAGSHGSTYGGNPVACAAALAAIETMKVCNLPGRAAHIGEVAFTRLREAARHIPAIGEVRGRGAMIAVELVIPGTTTPDPALAKTIAARALEQGVIVLICGTYGNVVRLLPPLVIGDDTLTDGLDVFIAAIEEEANA